MIPRYQKKEISNIWSDQHKFETFLKAELAIIKAQEGTNIPIGTSEKIKALAKIDLDLIEQIENEVKHDVIAFSSSITKNLPIELGKFFHYGVTSSDIIDTSLSLQIKESLEVILITFEKLLATLKKVATENKHIIAFGRSHGMNAEPMSFGQKWLGHYFEFKRRYDDYTDFLKNELTGQFSGAVGNYTVLNCEIEEKALTDLGLHVETLSTQIIPRDRIAKLVSIGSLLASAIERIAVEIRHLHHSDINELHESLQKKQKGSSIMPHKKNPIASENLSGIARILRSHQLIALENIVLWHERDISHSSAERLYLPDHFGLILYALERLEKTIDSLEFHTENIEQKVLKDQSYLSSYFLHEILDKCDHTREEVYSIIQKASFDYQGQINNIASGKNINNNNNNNNHVSFVSILNRYLHESKINFQAQEMTLKEIRKIYLKETDKIFNRSNSNLTNFKC